MTHVQWYYDNREKPWVTMPPKDDDWSAFSEAENQMIEEGLKNRKMEVYLGQYTIDIVSRLQYKTTDHTKQRPVMRREAMTRDHMYRTQRFTYPAIPETKSTASCGIYMSPFIQEFLKRNPHWMYKSDFPAQVGRGLIAEGRLSPEQVKIVDKFPKLSLAEVKKKCVLLYTMPSELCQHVNNALRQNDLSKVDTYGPFCCTLNKFLSENETDSDDEPISLVYRGVNLTQDNLEEYKKSIGKVKSWLAFSSTSTEENVANIFSANTLFKISPATVTTPFFPGKTIKEDSCFQQEDEVLLQPGVDFRISEVNESTVEGKKHVIYLTLL